MSCERMPKYEWVVPCRSSMFTCSVGRSNTRRQRSDKIRCLGTVTTIHSSGPRVSEFEDFAVGQLDIIIVPDPP